MSPETMSSGNAFIDDNHAELLDHIDAITRLVRDDWNQDEFKSSVINFVTNLESHFSHEEIILMGAGYADLDSHSIKHSEISLQLRAESLNPLDYTDAIKFMMKLRAQIFRHELLEDQDYWPLFVDKNSNPDILILWSQELEIGDPETDKHHKALINHINRLHNRFSAGSDIDFACQELRLLWEYSEFHFAEEEHLLGRKLRAGHRENHENLLIDLDVLIDEVRNGKFGIPKLGDYLKYWLISHIKNFDIPAFEG